MLSEPSLNLGSVPPIGPNATLSQRDQMLDKGACWLGESNQEISIGLMALNCIPDVLNLRFPNRRIYRLNLDNNVQCLCRRWNSSFQKTRVCCPISDRNHPTHDEVSSAIPLICRTGLSDPHHPRLSFEERINQVFKLRAVELLRPLKQVIRSENCILFSPTLKKLGSLSLKLPKAALALHRHESLCA